MGNARPASLTLCGQQLQIPVQLAKLDGHPGGSLAQPGPQLAGFGVWAEGGRSQAARGDVTCPHVLLGAHTLGELGNL